MQNVVQATLTLGMAKSLKFRMKIDTPVKPTISFNSQTSVAQTRQEPWKFVRAMGSSIH